MSNSPQKKLHELPFMDLYVNLDGTVPAHYRKSIRKVKYGEAVEAAELDTDVPIEFKDEIDKMTVFLREKFTEAEMGLTFDGIRLRAAKVTTVGGLVWAAMRRINEAPPKLDKLGLIPGLVPHLRKLGYRDGLVLISGATGMGKTTTSCSLLADFLENIGGVAFTIEDPVEYDLEGRRGKSGFCYQVEVNEDAEWGEMLKRALRWHPRYIFVGEIRTPDAANQLLRAATTGHLVMTTVHAGTIEEALEGILHLAEQSIGDHAANLLATGITGVFNQTLTNMGLNMHFLVTEPDNPGSPLRSVIRDRRIGQLRTFSDQQMALLRQSGKIFRDQ